MRYCHCQSSVSPSARAHSVACVVARRLSALPPLAPGLPADNCEFITKSGLKRADSLLLLAEASWAAARGVARSGAGRCPVPYLAGPSWPDSLCFGSARLAFAICMSVYPSPRDADAPAQRAQPGPLSHSTHSQGMAKAWPRHGRQYSGLAGRLPTWLLSLPWLFPLLVKYFFSMVLEQVMLNGIGHRGDWPCVLR